MQNVFSLLLFVLFAGCWLANVFIVICTIGVDLAHLLVNARLQVVQLLSQVANVGTILGQKVTQLIGKFGVRLPKLLLKQFHGFLHVLPFHGQAGVATKSSILPGVAALVQTFLGRLTQKWLRFWLCLFLLLHLHLILLALAPVTLLLVDALHVVFELASLLEVVGGDHDLLQLAVHVDVEAVKLGAMVHQGHLRAS